MMGYRRLKDQIFGPLTGDAPTAPKGMEGRAGFQRLLFATGPLTSDAPTLQGNGGQGRLTFIRQIQALLEEWKHVHNKLIRPILVTSKQTFSSAPRYAFVFRFVFLASSSLRRPQNGQNDANYSRFRCLIIY